MRRSLRRSVSHPSPGRHAGNDQQPQGIHGGWSPGQPEGSASSWGQTTSGAGETNFGSSLFALPWWDRRARIITLWIPAVLLILSILWALLLYWLSRNANQDFARENLQSRLSANVAALQLWLQDQEAQAKRTIRDAGLQGDLTRWLDEPDSTRGRERDTNRLTLAIQKKVEAQRFALDAKTAREVLGWVVLDDRCQAKLHSAKIRSTSMDGFQDGLERAYRDGSSVSSPILLNMADGSSRPAMAAMAAIRRGVRPVGAFALLIDPSGQFSDLLSVSRTGTSGETYAFNHAGQLISRSRFEDELKDLGLIDPSESATSILSVTVKDPGEDVRYASSTTLENIRGGGIDLPFTTMFQSASELESDSNVTGYRSYRGIPVIGAWHWLEPYAIGIASEIETEEAYDSLRLLRISLWIVVGLLSAIAACLVAFSYLIRRLVRRTATMQGKMRRLGRYDLFEVIGQGGMGTVYRGRHELLARDVAVKVLEKNENEGPTSTVGDERARLRFEREVQMTSFLRHPNTINIYDYGRSPDGVFFYVMEYVEGVSLRRLIQADGAQPAGRVIHMLTQVCGSIQEAHSHDLVHRDIKPGNIVLTNFSGSYDMVKVLDFGLVRNITAKATINADDPNQPATSSLTGTPMYMPPEVIRDSEAAGHQSDIYAIGAVGYHLLTGVMPYVANSVAEICAKRLQRDPDRPDQRLGRDLPEDLQNVLMSCLRADPQERPQSAEQLADSLRQCQDAGSWQEIDALAWWKASSEELRPPTPISLEEFHGQDALASIEKESIAFSSLGWVGDSTSPALPPPPTTDVTIATDQLPSFIRDELGPKKED